jgi:hypothetical protein
MLVDDARVWFDWFDLDGAFGVDVTLASDLGVFGEDCDAMAMISVEGRIDEMRNW